MVQLRIFQPDDDSAILEKSASPEELLMRAAYQASLQLFVREHGIDRLPPGAFEWTVDTSAPETEQLIQLSRMLAARRILAGLNSDGSDPQKSRSSH